MMKNWYKLGAVSIALLVILGCSEDPEKSMKENETYQILYGACGSVSELLFKEEGFNKKEIPTYCHCISKAQYEALGEETTTENMVQKLNELDQTALIESCLTPSMIVEHDAQSVDKQENEEETIVESPEIMEQPEQTESIDAM